MKNGSSILSKNMPQKLFITGDDVLYMIKPGQPLQKFKVVNSMWDKKTNDFLYKIKNKEGEIFEKISEKLLMMD